MSLLLQAMTSEDDAEIKESLALVLKASRLGLVHESINVNRIKDYTSKLTRTLHFNCYINIKQGVGLHVSPSRSQPILVGLAPEGNH